MPFDSYCYVLLFLPIFVLAWKAVAIVHREALSSLLIAFSVVFCLLASPASLLLFACLIPVNYFLGLALAAPGERDGSLRRRGLLGLGLACNAAPLVLIRYLPLLSSHLGFSADLATDGFLLSFFWMHMGAAPAPDSSFMLETARLAGFSFWILVQTAWLMGVYQRRFEPEGLYRHVLFSLAFPYLLAGPIVRYEQMGPQYDNLRAPKNMELARGLGLFVTGLVKKCLLADWLGSHADTVFAAAAAGFPLTTAEAWVGTLAFSLQIYFDFSAYTDMAMGAGMLIGLRLPDNFNAPYRASGFIEFWHRWHITFSAWLRDCIFTPLAGRWPSAPQLTIGLAAAIFINGVWHGSAPTFLVWAALHGLFLLLNVVLRAVRGPMITGLLSTPPLRVFCVLLTFGLVTLTWVVFRSANLSAALDMYSLLLGFGPAAESWFGNGYFTSWMTAVPIIAGLAVVFVLPPARAVFLGRRDGGRAWFSFGFSTTWAAVLACAALLSLAVMDRARPFIF